MSARFGHLAPECIRNHRPIGNSHAGEHAGDGVVVRLRDGLKFVIVTTRAAKREAKEGAADGVHALLPFVGPGGFDNLRRQLQFLPVGRAQAEETECGVVLGIAALDEVIGELLLDELVVRQIAV